MLSLHYGVLLFPPLELYLKLLYVTCFYFPNYKQADELALQKSLHGFEMCTAIAAHYALSEYVDNVIIYLCKNSTLLVSGIDTNSAVIFGTNRKANLAAVTVYMLLVVVS